MTKRVCLKCGKEIDLKKDLHVLLGTYDGERIIKEDYFHMICWRHYFEDCARNKAQAVVDGYQEKMMPIAKQLTEKLKKEIDERSGGSAPLITK